MSRFTSSFIRASKPATIDKRGNGSNGSKPPPQEAQHIREAYEGCAANGASGLCCSPAKVYSPEELASLPEEVLRLSSSCGTPVTDANLKPGDTIIDIGSGAGADCFLAAQIVGPEGTVIGVDPSPTMREIAGRNRDELKLESIKFLEGTAGQIPVPDATADVVISNCVLSLASDPTTVWREIARVLRPGGRFVISDVLGGVRPASLESKTRCESGLSWSEYREILAQTGFTEVEPLRVRSVTFRDGYETQSVSVQGLAGTPGRRGIQVYAGSQQQAVQRLAAVCKLVEEKHKEQLSVRLFNLDDPEAQAVLRLILEQDGDGCAGAIFPAVTVVGEGRLIATWDAMAADDAFLAEGLLEVAVNYLLDQPSPLAQCN